MNFEPTELGYLLNLENKKAKKGYVRILEGTKNSMINKLLNEINLIQKSCDNCIKRNKEIFDIFKDYKE